MTDRAWVRFAGLFVSVLLTVSAGGVDSRAGASPGPRSGIDTEYRSPSTRPQDDLYRYLNGKWLDEFQIPADKGRYVSFTEVADRTEDQLHGLVDDLSHRAAARGAARSDDDERKLSDLYASFVDESRLEGLGIKPLEHTFAA